MAASDSEARPLAGLRVVDLADEKGELCGRLLADLGADVLRVERPGGAISRGLPPFHADASLAFAFRNAGKRGATLDLAAGAGRARLHELLASADVLIESFAPAERAAARAGSGRRTRAPPGARVRIALRLRQSRPLPRLGRHRRRARCHERHGLQGGPPEQAAADPAGRDRRGRGVVHRRLRRAARALSAPPVRLGPAHRLLDAARDLADHRLVVLQHQHPAQRRPPDHGGAERLGPRVHHLCLQGRLRAADRALAAPVARDVGVARQARGLRRPALGDLHRAAPERGPADEALRGALREHEHGRSLRGGAAARHRVHAGAAPRRGAEQRAPARPQDLRGSARGAGRLWPLRLRLRRVRWRAARAEPRRAREGRRRHGCIPRSRGAAVASEGRHRPRRTARPLAGVRVLDFGIGGVGVEAGRLLAEYGAEVIKVETRTYPDFMRTVTGGWTSPSFASSSRSKQSFGVNVKKPAGLAQLKKLIAQADVIVENSATGTLDDMGIGWKTIQALNPRAILVSSQLMGSRGPWASWIGYGPSTQPVGGLVHLWNYDDQEAPAGSASIFPDHLVGRICAFAALAALLRRERTGRGGHVEVAQIEAVTGMLGELLLKAGLEPGSVKPRGNQNERGAPWGIYPAFGTQQWCAITVRDDADWKGLRAAMEDPAWARAAAYDTAAGRLARQAELDAQLGAWTQQHEKRSLAAKLQSHGVPAGPMCAGTDLLDDPHFQAWNYGREVEVEPLGRMSFEGPCWSASAMADADVRPSPKLGEHTREIARRLLGLSDAEIERLVADGALEDPPAPPLAR